MFSSREFVCAIELGTSKCCVLIGEIGSGGRPEVIGRGCAATAGSVIKGEISDMERAGNILVKALEEADRASGGALEMCRLVSVLVTGCGIDSRRGCGIVTIKNPDRIVTAAERLEANDNAKIIDLAPDCEIINTSESYFLVDKRRVSNPLRQSGSRLEAYVHIVHAQSSRLGNFRSVVREAGLEEVRLEPVFSPLAAGIGIISDAERENGALMIDLGAGTTEYLIYQDRGVCASGLIQLGMEHVANDLAIGLDQHIDTCRRLLAEGILERALQEHQEFLELPASGGRTRKVPTASCEAIVDARIREIFEIVRLKLAGKKVSGTLGGGGILTGGGAGYFRSRQLFCDVFDLSCRIGQPSDPGGAVTGLDNPRYSAVWGALKIAAYFQQQFGPPPENMIGRLFRKFNQAIDRKGGKDE